MRIKVENDTYTKEVYDSETGQSLNLSHTSKTEYRYYSIKKLNLKVCTMDIAQAQAKICKSSKDIIVFWTIIDDLDKYNEFRSSVSALSQKLGVARSKVTAILARAIEHKLLKRIGRGVYSANPFMVKSKGSTNEIIERLQVEWNKM